MSSFFFFLICALSLTWWLDELIPSFHKYLSNSYCVPSPVLEIQWRTTQTQFLSLEKEREKGKIQECLLHIWCPYVEEEVRERKDTSLGWEEITTFHCCYCRHCSFLSLSSMLSKLSFLVQRRLLWPLWSIMVGRGWRWVNTWINTWPLLTHFLSPAVFWATW